MGTAVRISKLCAALAGHLRDGAKDRGVGILAHRLVLGILHHPHHLHRRLQLAGFAFSAVSAPHRIHTGEEAARQRLIDHRDLRRRAGIGAIEIAPRQEWSAQRIEIRRTHEIEKGQRVVAGGGFGMSLRCWCSIRYRRTASSTNEPPNPLPAARASNSRSGRRGHQYWAAGTLPFVRFALTSRTWLRSNPMSSAASFPKLRSKSPAVTNRTSESATCEATIHKRKRPRRPLDAVRPP